LTLNSGGVSVSAVTSKETSSLLVDNSSVSAAPGSGSHDGHDHGEEEQDDLKDDQSSTQANAGGDALVGIGLPGGRSHLVNFVEKKDLVGADVVVVPVQNGGGEVTGEAGDVEDSRDEKEGMS